MKKITLIKSKQDSRTLQKKIIDIINNREMSAYDITKKILKKKENEPLNREERYQYHKIVSACKVLEQKNIIKTKRFEEGGGPIPKRIYVKR